MRRTGDPIARVLSTLGDEGPLEYEVLRAATGLRGLDVVQALEVLEQEGRVRMDRVDGRVLWLRSSPQDLADRFSQRVPGRVGRSVRTDATA